MWRGRIMQVLREAGRPVSQEDYKRFIIDPALFSIPEDLELAIEPDWSAAAAMLVAGALSGSVEVSANPGSLQADILVLDILDKAGAVINFTAGGVIVSQPPGGSLAAFDADLRDAPDLFPVLSVLAAHCHGVSRLSGLGRLTHKETNRREAIAEMLAAFGVSTQVSGDDLVIAGPQSFKQGVADGKGDHRVVMAAVLCALRAPGASTITGAEAVSKSYPGFFRDLQALGLDCQLVS